MATYGGEKAANLDAALASVYTQTLPPDECILVVDGAIDSDQEQVIARYQDDPADPSLIIVRLSERGGLARALNAGLDHCHGALIARMDSDDICLPHRFERQRRAFVEQPALG